MKRAAALALLLFALALADYDDTVTSAIVAVV